MKKLLLVAALAAIVVPAAGLAQDDLVALREELTRIEKNLDQLKRALPLEFDRAAERKRIDTAAEKAEVKTIQFKALGSEPAAGEAGVVLNRVEISGHGSYSAIHFFLNLLRFRPRVVDIEWVRFTARPDKSVAFAAGLMFPSWERAPTKTSDVRDVVVATRQKLAKTRAIFENVVEVLARKFPDDALEALSTFTQEIDEHPIAIRSARFENTISMEGLVPTVGARAVVTRALDKARLRIASQTWSAAGPCQTFSITARYDALESDLGLELVGYTPGRDVFDEGVAFCRDEAQPALRRISVRGAAPPQDQQFFMRLRSIDLAGLSFVLNDLLNESFMVDRESKARLDLDVLAAAGKEDLLKALSEAGVFVSSGPLSRISLTRPADHSAPRKSGQPLTLSFWDVELSEILCIVDQISGREVRMAKDHQRRLSIFATDIPADTLFDELVPKSTAAATKACGLSSDSGSRLTKRSSLADIAIADVRVAGLVQMRSGWKGYVSAPGGQLHVIEAGRQMFDGTVKSISAKGVTFASNAKGVVEVAFVP